MVTNSSKKDEVAGRGRQIVNAAFTLLEQGGLSAVRLDRVAELIGCTRTTLYNHFANREEMLIEMAAQAVSYRHRLFEAATTHTLLATPNPHLHNLPSPNVNEAHLSHKFILRNSCASLSLRRSLCPPAL